MSVRDQILSDLKKALKKLNLQAYDIHLEHPAALDHGDYATNVALQLAKIEQGKVWHSPLVLANEITKVVQEYTQNYAKVTVAKPGFINFTLTPKALLSELQKILTQKENFGKGKILKGKKILLEHTSPDPIKTLHIGHLRNNFLGMALSRILESLGAKVVKDCINNDRGVHVCQAMFGFLAFAKKGIGVSKDDLLNFKVSDEDIARIGSQAKWRNLLDKWFKARNQWLNPEDLGLKSDHFDLVIYAVGARAEEKVEGIGEQIREILRAWEAEEEKVWALWRRIIDWSLEGYEVTYKRIGSIHDFVWHESKLYKGGKNLIHEGLKKGVFRKSEGAVVTDLSQYNLPDTIVIKSDGTALYQTFDINLVKKKREKFPADLYVWDIGNDQILYLKQLFAMAEQLGIGKRSDYFHLNYGYVYLKGKGKMSSRRGMVVKADDLLDFVHQKSREIIETSDQDLRGRVSEKKKEEIAEAVGLAGLKYGLLKYNRESDIYFDPEKSLSLEGDSGPYLQYTHARAKSVLVKANQLSAISYQLSAINVEELALLRTLYKFPEVVEQAGQTYAPNLICTFLFDLAQKFNLFYTKHPILKPTRDVEKLRNFRLALTSATAQVLKNGLLLLGIEPLERM